MKIFLSLMILFHLFVILSIPNSSSYFHNIFKPVFTVYSNLLNIGYNWQFFSPDPASSMFFLYEVSDGKKIIFEGSYPEKENMHLFRALYTRRNAIKNFLSRNDDLAKKLLGDYICRQYAGAYSVQLRKEILIPVTLDEAKQGRPLNDTSKKKYQPVGKYFCDLGQEI